MAYGQDDATASALINALKGQLKAEQARRKYYEMTLKLVAFQEQVNLQKAEANREITGLKNQCSIDHKKFDDETLECKYPLETDK